MTTEPSTDRDDNPYQVLPSASADNLSAPGGDGNKVSRRVGAWVIVFLLNLPVPVMLGKDTISGAAGALGMTVGCLLWCGLGIVLCFGTLAKHVEATSLGGILVALSQVMPIVQMMSGMIAMGIVSLVGEVLQVKVGFGDVPPFTDVTGVGRVALAGCLTLITGLLLIGLAFVLGHGMRAISRQAKR